MPDRHAFAVSGALLLLMALVVTTFHSALGGPFVFDDFPNLQNLKQVDGTLTWESVRRYLAAFNGNPSRPLATLSFLIEDAAWPAYPADFKRDNLLFHLLVGLLVFAFTRALSARLPIERRAADWLALLCTTAWLVHPIQLSATMLVVQRMNILSALFMLAGLIAYVRVLTMSQWREFARVAAAGTALGFFGTVAFLCKENGALIFAYATALNVTLLSDTVARVSKPWRHLLTWGVALPVIGLGLVALINYDTIANTYRIRDFTLGERLLTECRILIDYLRIILLPRIGGLSVFHDDYQISHGLLDPASTLFALLAIMGLGGTAIALRRRSPVYAFAVLWFFAGHLLESTVYPLELYFEHRNYLPMLGPLFAMAYAAFAVGASSRRLALALLVVWIAIGGALTRINSDVWGDREKLTRVWLLESPNSKRALQMAAGYYNDVGDHTIAARVLDDGIRRLPDDQELVFQRVLLDCINVGIKPSHMQRLQTAAGATRTIGTIPSVFATFVAQELGPRCQGTLHREDLKRLGTALMANPLIAGDAPSMGFLHYELARLELNERNLDGVMQHMDESWRHRKSPFVPREQAIYLLTAGLPEEALEYLDKSDQTPLPLVKRWLLDMPERNRSLRESAKEMIGSANETTERALLKAGPPAVPPTRARQDYHH